MRTLLETLRENSARRKIVLFGNSSTLDGMKNILDKFFGKGDFSFKLISKDPERYSIFDKKTKMDGIWVVKKGSQYRVETEQ